MRQFLIFTLVYVNFLAEVHFVLQLDGSDVIYLQHNINQSEHKGHRLMKLYIALFIVSQYFVL